MLNAYVNSKHIIMYISFIYILRVITTLNTLPGTSQLHSYFYYTPRPVLSLLNCHLLLMNPQYKYIQRSVSHCLKLLYVISGTNTINQKVANITTISFSSYTETNKERPLKSKKETKWHKPFLIKGLLYIRFFFLL
jgi:hypothetical protein